MTPRKEVYEAIDSERAYQDSRWNESTTTSGGHHSISEWLAYIEDYLREAQHILAREPKQVSDPKAIQIVRKLAGMTVKCMEEHGAPRREGF